MTSSPSALEALAASVERAIADDSLGTERAVQLRAVEPLVEVLGWDLRAGEVTPAATIAGVDVEYRLAIDDRPVLAIATIAPDGDLAAVLDELETVLTQSRVDRGLATDGETVALVAASGGELHRRSFEFAALPEHADDLGQFHRDILASSVGTTREDREAARRRIVEHREEIVDAVAAELLAVTGPAVESTVTAESERTVESLLDSLASDDESVPDPPATDDGSAEQTDDRTGGDQTGDEAGGARTDAETGGARTATPEASAEFATTQSAPSESTSGSVAGAEAGAEAGDEAGDDVTVSETDETYVARFFGGSSSVGAVGTDSPAGTTTGVVRYLLENHELEASITLPWHEPGGRAVIDADPDDGDWAELRRADGKKLFVQSIDDPAVARGTIEALAEACGLRVMFQGDW